MSTDALARKLNSTTLTFSDTGKPIMIRRASNWQQPDATAKFRVDPRLFKKKPTISQNKSLATELDNQDAYNMASNPLVNKDYHLSSKNGPNFKLHHSNTVEHYTPMDLTS